MPVSARIVTALPEAFNSTSVYDNTSVAAVGVAAHECGHAVQDNKGYAPLRIRAALVPAANIGATVSWPEYFENVDFTLAEAKRLKTAPIITKRYVGSKYP